MSKALTPAQKKQATVRNQLRSMLERASEKYVYVLPKHISADRMVQIAINAATNSPKLFDCDPGSFALAVMTASECGLEPDGYHGHLIPYGKTCQFVPDYKGLIQLALRYGTVIDSYVVYENDEFEYTLGLDPHIHHRPIVDGPRGEKKCAYAIAKMANGRTKFVVATKEDIEKRRKQSASSNKADSPWRKWEDEMWQKTAIKMLMRFVPRSTPKDINAPEPIQAALRADDLVEMGTQQRPMGIESNVLEPSKMDTLVHKMEEQQQEDSPLEIFCAAIEAVGTPEEIDQLYQSMIHPNKKHLGEEVVAHALEATEVRKAVLRGEL